MNIKFFNVVLLLLSITSFSQIVNEGVLKINDGTTVYFGEEYTNKATGTHTNEGNLHLNGNLVNNGTMSLSANADAANGITYFDSPTNATSTVNTVQTITGTNAVVFENVQVNMTDPTSVGVSVADGLEVVVEKGVNLNSGDFRLLGEAQLIQKHTGADANVGTGNLLRDQQGTVDTYNYNYWSSPVTETGVGTYTVGNVLFDGTDSGLNPFTPTAATFSTGSPWNGMPSVLDGLGNVTTPLNVESYWIWKFDNGLIDNDNDWFLMRETGAFNVGLGFTMKGTGAATANQNLVFKGRPNDGSYSFVISSGRSYMLGNPYPSALDAYKFINDNSTVLSDGIVASVTTGAIYYWEHFGGGSHVQSAYQGGYATLTLAGGTLATTHPNVSGGGANSGILASRYIPVGQGFFVESSTTAGGGTITIDNSQRVFQLEGATSFFRRPNNTNTEEDITKSEEEDTTSRIRLGYNSPNGFYRQIMTAFIPECNDGHNTAYDARMAYIHNDEMYWIINSTPYVIDARPFGIEKQIPIGIKVSEAGAHKIYLDEAENFTGDIYILDQQTGYTTDIRQEEFKVNLAIGEYKDRFKLVFHEYSPLNVDDILSESLQVFYTNADEDVIIKNPTNLEIKSVTIFNAIGQVIKKVSKDKLVNNLEIKIPFHVASGTYIVQIDANIGKKGFKIIAY